MYPPTVSGPVMIYMSSSTFSFVVSTVPNCPYCSLATCGYCLCMNVMKVSFMRNITTISISLSDKRVFPSVTTWLAHELMRSQKLDAKRQPTEPLLKVAI